MCRYMCAFQYASVVTPLFKYHWALILETGVMIHHLFSALGIYAGLATRPQFCHSPLALGSKKNIPRPAWLPWSPHCQTWCNVSPLILGCHDCDAFLFFFFFPLRTITRGCNSKGIFFPEWTGGKFILASICWHFSGKWYEQPAHVLIHGFCLSFQTNIQETKCWLEVSLKWIHFPHYHTLVCQCITLLVNIKRLLLLFTWTSLKSWTIFQECSKLMNLFQKTKQNTLYNYINIWLQYIYIRQIQGVLNHFVRIFTTCLPRQNWKGHQHGAWNG